MDRLNRLREEVGATDVSSGSDTGFHTANDTTAESTNYLSFIDDDVNTPKKQEKETSLSESTPRPAIVDSRFGSGLSPIVQHDRLGIEHIDAKNILSGGIEIFEDGNSNDGDGLIIDDDAVNANEDVEPGPIESSEKVICEPNESASLLLNEDEQVPLKDILDAPQSTTEIAKNEEIGEATEEEISNNEVTLLIDGKNVDALHIGNGLYLYRKEEGGELHAIQMILQEDGQTQFKFLKVRQIGDSNLEVYEEQILEIPITNEELEQQRQKEKQEEMKSMLQSKCSHLPISDVKKALIQEIGNTGKTVALNPMTNNENTLKLSSSSELTQNSIIDKKIDGSGDLKINPLKNIECSRKSPILGNLTCMTLHSSSKKDGAPPTKTMINFPLNSTRISDSLKKTIAVSTDNSNLKNTEKTFSVKSDVTSKNKSKISTECVEISDPASNKSEQTSSETILAKNVNSVVQKELIEFPNAIKNTNKTITDKNLCLVNEIMECCHEQSNVMNNVEVNTTEIKSKYVENKKDSNLTKTNIVSKWVLRSDSVDEKSKKEREKSTVETKPINSYGSKHASEEISSVDNSKFKSFDRVVSSGMCQDNSKIENKDRVMKVVPKTPLIIESRTSQYSMSNNYQKSIPKREENKSKKPICNKGSSQSLHKDSYNIKSVPAENKNVNKETTSTQDCLKKQNNQALIYIPATDKIKSKDESMSKSLDISAHDGIKTNSASALQNKEYSKKPVPFGQWTEGDQQQYLNKLKDQKLPSVAATLSQAKSYQLANNLRKLEMKKNPKAESFERVFLSKIENESLTAKLEDKPAKDVDMNNIINTTIEGLIMKTLKGPAGQPPALNHPRINTAQNIVEADEKHEITRMGPSQIEIDNASVKGTYVYKTNNSKLPEASVKPADSNLVSTAEKKLPTLLPLNSKVGKIESPFSEPLPSIEDEDSEDEIIDSEPVTGDMQWPSPGGKEGQKVTVAELQKMIESKNKDPKVPSTPVNRNLNVVKAKSNVVTKNSLAADNSESLKKSEKTNEIDLHGKFQKIDDIKKNITFPESINATQSQIASNKTQALLSNVPHAISLNEITSKSSSHCPPENITTYHTKVQLAYQLALSEKNLKTPVKILDDQIVKTQFVTATLEQVQNVPTSSQNVEVSCKKKQETKLLEMEKSSEVIKSYETSVVKTKHQRKQILTSVETPPIEIIEHPNELDSAHKRKRKIENKPTRVEADISDTPTKDPKIITPKKNYLLRMSIIADETKNLETNIHPNSNKNYDTKNKNYEKSEKVGDAVIEKEITELIDQSETPKRGRGRPRKKPVDNNLKNESPKSASPVKHVESDCLDMHSSTSTVDEEESEEEGIPRENWTMGKINDKIVCPICNKLFRSETIVFKHVKHCSTLLKSPTKRSRETEHSTESPNKKGKTEHDFLEESRKHFKKTKEAADEYQKKSVAESKYMLDDSNIQAEPDVIILDTPKTNVKVMEDNPKTQRHAKFNENIDKMKLIIPTENQKSVLGPVKPKNKVGRPRSTSIYTCEVCGKIFRQLSYLNHHKTQHKEPPTSSNPVVENKPLSCEVCQKEFRKLHHLVEHREIHNPNSIYSSNLQRKPSTDKHVEHREINNSSSNSALHRKLSVDNSEQKKEPEPSILKTISKPDELTAGFRCEPCDKSFRKLHHLVEHRETHDGLHKQKTSPPQVLTTEKVSTESPTCEVCGKSFRKLHHLIEHREQHSEANVEKKERKSSLLAKDIIHECSLCYMVFPNEPSLNKHFVNCVKKKNKSNIPLQEENKTEDNITTEPSSEVTNLDIKTEKITSPECSKHSIPVIVKPVSSVKRNSNETEQKYEIPEKMLKNESAASQVSNLKQNKTERITKNPAKIGLKAKHLRKSLATVPEDKSVETKDSDDEERYMINPSYQEDSEDEKEIFINICVSKRNSLNFDRPSSEAEFKKRRTSLQHPPKNQKLINKKTVLLEPTILSDASKSTKLLKRSNSSVPSTSKDSVKYALPKSTKFRTCQNKIGIPEPKTQTARRLSDERAKKIDKRKSLTGIAKRKSLGKSVGIKPAVLKTAPSTIKKELKKVLPHVCDCGAPFSSVTLLAQHTSVAHTPPRARKPRPPPPAKHAGVPVALKKHK